MSLKNPTKQANHKIERFTIFRKHNILRIKQAVKIETEYLITLKSSNTKTK